MHLDCLARPLSNNIQIPKHLNLKAVHYPLDFLKFFTINNRFPIVLSNYLKMLKSIKIGRQNVIKYFQLK